MSRKPSAAAGPAAPLPFSSGPARFLGAAAVADLMFLAVAGLVIRVGFGGGPLPGEAALLRAAADAAAALPPAFVEHVSALGSRTVLTAVVLTALGGLLLHRDVAGARFLALSAVGAGVVDLAVKALVARPRPFDFDPAITALDPHAAGSFSFPSGHAMGSATVYLSAGLLAAARSAPGPAALYPLAVAAVAVAAVGATRVMLQVHYPGDVLAGWVAGGVWVWAVARAFPPGGDGVRFTISHEGTAMNVQEFEKVLRASLADFKLSGAEKQSIAKMIADARPTEQLLGAYRKRAFELAAETLGDAAARSVVGWLDEVTKAIAGAGGKGGAGAAPAPGPSAGGAMEVYFSPGEECTRRIIGLFDGARTSADVCVFTITDDRIANAILAAHRRGVKVRVISDDEKSGDQGSDIGKFQAAGIPVRLDRSPAHMHHKFAVFDGSLVLNGSFNWTRSAANQNQENIIVSSDPRLLSAFTRAFDKLWSQFG
jgi:membrane-associated phospholipid phosphatase